MEQQSEAVGRMDVDDAELLMLIDGHSLVHRAFHALPDDLMTTSGELTNAVLGFASILLKEIGELHPSHIILAMDRPVKTFRHEAFAGYKATRPPTPKQLVSQFGRVRELAEAMHIPIYEIDGFEADDVLGTLSRQAEERGLPTVIVTGDLDALQLVSDSVHVLTPGRGITETTRYDPERVRARFQLTPEQLPDWKALVGDSSDNIPGVSGIGQKTASELLGIYRTLEGIYEHLEELTPKRRELLEPAREQAMQSRELARIVRTVPVELAIERAAYADLDRSRVIDLFRELEFTSLIPRLPGGPRPPGVEDAITPSSSPPSRQLTIFAELDTDASQTSDDHSGVATPLVETRVVRTREDLAALVDELSAAARIAVDTETTSTDPLRARLVGLSFATVTDRAWYVPVGHSEGEQLPLSEVLDTLRPVLGDQGISKVGHNLKYDYAVLAKQGVRLCAVDCDSMIAAFLVKPVGRGLSLSALALARLNQEMTPIERLIGKGKSQITMDQVDIETTARYAGDDAAVTLQLMNQLALELEEQRVGSLFRDIEMPLVTVLAEMEMAGVALDTGVLAEMSGEMAQAIGELEGRIYERVGHRFNINSTQQLGQVLFQELKLPSGRRTKTGYSTDSEVLENLRERHPIVADILEYRQLIKLKSTYVDALPSLINQDTGRVHTDFNQTVASTGRLSSSNPNLQNIPIRGELGRKIRRAFVPGRQDHVLLAADYSQIELRILAAMSGDERLVEAFRSGEDIHRATASAVFNVSRDEVTPDQRRIAKVVNFGIIYGIGEQRLAHETGISRAEAAEFIANYNRTYAGVKSFMDNLRKRAIIDQYVTTLLGRRRHIPEINSTHPGVRAGAERAAINMPIQGTAADIIKIAMIRLQHGLAEEYPETKMVLQVHDELVFDVAKVDVAGVARLVCNTMENAVKLNVPLEVELKAGADWYDMAPVEVVS